MLSDREIDFQTARQVNNKLKEPRRLKKDTMAQTSINAFFTKKDKKDGDDVKRSTHAEQQPKKKSANGTTAAHNGTSNTNSTPNIQVKSEAMSDTELSDAETVINSPPRVKDEPIDPYEMQSHDFVPKTERDDFPPSDEDTDVEMDIDPTLANHLDPTVIVKAEPRPIEKITVESILSNLPVNRAESPSDEKVDDVNRPVIKSEPVEYPPSDEATDDEMDIDPTLMAQLDPTVKVKTEPKVPTLQALGDVAASILASCLKEPEHKEPDAIVATASTSKSVQSHSKRKPEDKLERDSSKQPKLDVASITEPNPTRSRNVPRIFGIVNGVSDKGAEQDEVMTNY